MHFSKTEGLAVVRSERFRVPTRREREIGLWVDRVGAGEEIRSDTPKKLRRLGLYAAVCIIDGAGSFISTTTGKLDVGKGDAILLFPEIPSCYHPYSRWDSRWVVWGGPEADKLAELGMFNPSAPIVHGGADAVAAAFSETRPLLDRDDIEAALQMKIIVLDMLLSLRRLQIPSNAEPGRMTAEKAIKVIKENLGEDITVAGLAGKFGMSEQNFRRLFKAATGTSPKEFILTAKMARAKELLASRVSVKEVAAQLGFREEFYFRRIFRKTTGHTPGSYYLK